MRSREQRARESCRGDGERAVSQQSAFISLQSEQPELVLYLSTPTHDLFLFLSLASSFVIVILTFSSAYPHLSLLIHSFILFFFFHERAHVSIFFFSLLPSS